MGFDLQSLSEATSGAIGALVSTTILYPLDTCKTKYQAEVRAHHQKKYRWNLIFLLFRTSLVSFSCFYFRCAFDFFVSFHVWSGFDLLWMLILIRLKFTVDHEFIIMARCLSSISLKNNGDVWMIGLISFYCFPYGKLIGHEVSNCSIIWKTGVYFTSRGRNSSQQKNCTSSP